MTKRSDANKRNSAEPSHSNQPYEVGFGKPPAASRFRPGQSGNPKGRPKQHRNLRTELEATLAQMVTIRVGDHTRKVTKLTALTQSVANSALKGDAKALSALIVLMRACGLIEPAPPPSSVDEPITDQDLGLVQEYVARLGISAVQDEAAGQAGQTPPDTNYDRQVSAPQARQPSPADKKANR